MELLRHRSLEHYGSAVIAQLYDELLQKDVDACCDITQEAFVATKYILRYTLETSGITAMISQVQFILERQIVLILSCGTQCSTSLLLPWGCTGFWH